MRINKSVKMGELRSLSAFAVGKIEGANIDDPLLSNFSEKVAALAAELEEAMNAERSVSSLAEIDKKRDLALRALIHYSKGLSYSASEAEASAAKNVASILSRHKKSLARKNYEDETGIIDALLKDFESGEAKAAVEKAGCCAALIANLAAANDSFKSEKVKRNMEVQAEKSKDSAYHIRNALYAEFNSGLMHYLDAAVKGDAAVYGALYDSISAEVATINAKIALRKKASASE